MACRHRRDRWGNVRQPGPQGRRWQPRARGRRRSPPGGPAFRSAASALAAALARRAVSIGSMPLETGMAPATTGRSGGTAPGPFPLIDGSTKRNAGSMTVPGCGSRTGVRADVPLLADVPANADRSAGPNRAGSVRHRRIGEGVVGEGRRSPPRDGIRRHSDAHFTCGRGPGSEGRDKSRPRCDPEDQSYRQEGDLGRCHPVADSIRSRSSPSAGGPPIGQRSCGSARTSTFVHG